jgi:chaperonin GroEL
MAKQFAFEAQAREKLRRGFDQLADTVRITLGPRGRNVILDKLGGIPAITNDGVTVAKEIVLEDPFENVGAELAKEVSTKTQETSGDGTTTAVVIAQALVREGLRAVAGGLNPSALKRGMEKGAAAALDDIALRARKVRDKDDILAVAIVAAKNDEVLGRLIASALERVGRNGVVTVEEGKGYTTTLKVVEGMQFDCGYLSPYFVTDPERMVVELEKPYLLLHDRKITNLNDLHPLLEQVLARRRPLLVIAEDVEGEALATLVVNRLRGTFQAVAVKAPGFGDRKQAMLEDLAVLTGGTVISEATGRTLEGLHLADLGQADRVIVGSEETTILGGKGKKATLAARVQMLRNALEEATSEYDREHLEERLAKLSGGVGVIQVGAATEIAMKEEKSRAEDALAATRAAIEEGIVVGGGVTLLRAADTLDGLALRAGAEQLGGEILRQGLLAPLIQIAENAGLPGLVIAEKVRTASPDTVGLNALTGRIEDLAAAGVYDPAKVLRACLQNAVSIAGLVMTTETLVVDVPEDGASETEA